MTSSQILQNLNPAQNDAVIHRGGPMLVVAGAGSGKTRVLTHRIAHLIEQDNVNPFRFSRSHSNKAAQEMKDRGRCPRWSCCRKHVGLYLSLSMRTNAATRRRTAWLPTTFSIYDQADAVRLTGYVIGTWGWIPKFVARSIHADIEPKERTCRSQSALDNAASIFERKIAEIYRSINDVSESPVPWISMTY